MSPNPQSADWLRAYGRCSQIAPMQAVLGGLLMPSLKWTVYEGQCHAAAVGIDVDGSRIIMDVLAARRLRDGDLSLHRRGEQLSLSEALYELDVRAQIL